MKTLLFCFGLAAALPALQPADDPADSILELMEGQRREKIRKICPDGSKGPCKPGPKKHPNAIPEGYYLDSKGERVPAADLRPQKVPGPARRPQRHTWEYHGAIPGSPLGCMCKHFTCQNKVPNRKSKKAKNEQWERLCQRIDCCGCGRCLNPVDPGQYPIPDEGKLYLNSMATDFSMNMGIEECFDWLEGAGFTRAHGRSIRGDMDEVLAVDSPFYQTEAQFGTRYYTTVSKGKWFKYPPGCMVQIMSYHDPDVRISEVAAMNMPRKLGKLYSGESAHISLVYNAKKTSTVYDAFSECVKDPQTGDHIAGYCNDPEFVLHTNDGLELDYDGGSYYFPAAELGSKAIRPRYVGPAVPAKTQMLLDAADGDDGSVVTDDAGKTAAVAHEINSINPASICEYFTDKVAAGAQVPQTDLVDYFDFLDYERAEIGDALVPELSGMVEEGLLYLIEGDGSAAYKNKGCAAKIRQEEADEANSFM
jgi:hypothetical protein